MGYPWDYIKQWNTFMDLSLGTLTRTEVILYMRLFQCNNAIGRIEWFGANNLMIAGYAEMDEKLLIKTRNALKQKGFIDFIPGKKGQPTRYKLLLLYEIDWSETSEKPAKSQQKASESPSKKPVNHPDIIKDKEYKEKKSSAQSANAQDAQFDEFWKAYPKKKDKAKARKAYAKLKPDMALHKKMLTAIEKQKQSEQWQKDGGQFIPLPTTWINGERWEDEETVDAFWVEPHSQPISQDEQEKRRRERQDYDDMLAALAEGGT